MTKARRIVVETPLLAPGCILMQRSVAGQVVLLVGRNTPEDVWTALGVCAADFGTPEEFQSGGLANPGGTSSSLMAAQETRGVAKPPGARPCDAYGEAHKPMGLDSPADELWTRRGLRPPGHDAGAGA